MDNIESFLHDSPELVEKFLEDNRALLNQIKQTYADMLESGDLIGRFLLSKALMEIVRVTTRAGQELLKAEMAEQGLNVTNTKGHC